jgi:altronate dehydratase large subunit
MSVDSPGADAALSFEGYRRPDGRVGARNRVLALPSVICSHLVAEAIADRVDRAVAAPHDHGCGQLGADNAQTAAVLEGVAANPNIAGTVVVGLGCEEVQSGAVAEAIAGRGLPVEEVAIQDAGGTDACIETGAAAATDLVAHADAATAGPGSLDEVTVGVVGDLAPSTVGTVDPLVADLVGRVVAAGGRVAVAGTERFVAHPDETRERAVAAAREDVDALLARHRDQPARAAGTGARAAELDFAESAGLLGDEPIAEAVPYGEQASVDSGVALVDAPSRFEEAATALAAAGAHVVVHATGEGVPAGHPIVPVVKVSGDPETVAALPEDIDVDATDATAADLADAVRATLDGEPVCAERHGLTEFAITRIGPSM